MERTLRRYKADAFAYATEGDRATVWFRIAGRQVRFMLQMPDPNDREFTTHSRGRRTPDAAEKMWEQACRQRWRALSLVIKAKLEAVSAGITTIEDEFLAHTVLPNGETVGQWMQPQVDEAYRIGAMPTSLMLEGPRS
ncbi:MAG: hypothetical protein KA105_02535 [Caulobacter sp.]|nr:hypothetical protein [Caulobacter sp.]